MRITDRYAVRFTIAALLVGFGTSKLLAQLFLARWEILSAGQSDIAARGVWLLATFLPALTLGSVVLTIALLATLTRRTGPPLATRLLPGTVGATLGAVLVFLGADPTAFMLNLARWPSTLAYNVVSAVVALAVVIVGIGAAVRLARASPIVAAAA